MLGNQRRIPIPAVMNVAEFMERYASHEACVEHLRTVRWGPNLERFLCPACTPTRRQSPAAAKPRHRRSRGCTLSLRT